MAHYSFSSRLIKHNWRKKVLWRAEKLKVVEALLAGAYQLVVPLVRVGVQSHVRDQLRAYVQVDLVEQVALLVEAEQVCRPGLVVQPPDCEQVARVVDYQTQRIPHVQVANVLQQQMGLFVENSVKM